LHIFHPINSAKKSGEVIGHAASWQSIKRLFKRKYLLGDDGEIVKTKGEPMDVPVNSWIDVRLDMPNDSAFNQRMSQELQP